MSDAPNLSWLLGEAKDLLLAHLSERLAQAGHGAIRSPHGQVFRHLGPDGARLTDLADRAGMTKQAFAEHVAHLEEHGYLRRVPDPEDGRAKLVVPTRSGLAAMAVARAAFAELEEDWAQAIGRERMVALREGLEAIALSAHGAGSASRS